MRAVVQDGYGRPERLRLTDVPVPRPGPQDLLVRVAATSLNLSDWETLVGSPAYARVAGLRRPRHPIPGSDVAGVVEEVGSGVTAFSPGDRVVGDVLMTRGGLAELVAGPADSFGPVPDGLDLATASCVPQAGAIAVEGITGVGDGDRVLVNGAGGGAGTFALQLAAETGAVVTAVDTAAKAEHTLAMGADEAIDYRVTDITRLGRTWDLVLDLVATRSVVAYRRMLARGGRYRCVGGTTRALLRVSTVGALLGAATGRSIRMLAVRGGPDSFMPLVARVAAGEVRVHVDRRYPLGESAAALARVGAGESIGKVVVVVDAGLV